jgi:hypothetical protein
MNTDVAIGPSSLLGWLGALAGVVTTAVLSLSEHAALLSGPGKWSAVLATVSLVGTGLGRQFQAAHLTKAATVADDVAALPSAIQALAAQAQKNVAVVQAHPDGLDAPTVPFSGASASPAS